MNFEFEDLHKGELREKFNQVLELTVSDLPFGIPYQMNTGMHWARWCITSCTTTKNKK